MLSPPPGFMFSCTYGHPAIVLSMNPHPTVPTPYNPHPNIISYDGPLIIAILISIVYQVLGY